MGRIDARLADLGLVIQEPDAPLADYVPWVQADNLLFVSGQVPFDGGALVRGQLSAADHAEGTPPQIAPNSELERACHAARLCGIALIAQARAATGDLDRVRRVVKLVGFVNGRSDFQQAPTVINACSGLMAEVFGDAGRHARSAVTVANLPFGALVEVEAVFQLR